MLLKQSTPGTPGGSWEEESVVSDRSRLITGSESGFFTFRAGDFSSAFQIYQSGVRELDSRIGRPFSRIVEPHLEHMERIVRGHERPRAGKRTEEPPR